MKKIILIPIMVFSMTIVRAEYLPTIKVEDDKSFVLDINDWTTQELKVSFLSSEGTEIYTESFQPAKMKHRKYNLDQLPKGSYTVVVSDEFKNVTYNIEMSAEAVTLVSEGVTTFRPQVTSTNQILDINMLAQKSDVKISLYDENGNDLYSENIKDTPAITRRLNISQLEPGRYTLSIAAGKHSYYRSFSK